MAEKRIICFQSKQVKIRSFFLFLTTIVYIWRDISKKLLQFFLIYTHTRGSKLFNLLLLTKVTRCVFYCCFVSSFVWFCLYYKSFCTKCKYTFWEEMLNHNIHNIAFTKNLNLTQNHATFPKTDIVLLI